MKKNAIKFWFKNRFTAVGLIWVMLLIIVCASNNPYFNGFILTISSFASLFYGTYLLEEKKLNSSERLMWQKYSKLFEED